LWPCGAVFARRTGSPLRTGRAGLRGLLQLNVDLPSWVDRHVLRLVTIRDITEACAIWNRDNLLFVGAVGQHHFAVAKVVTASAWICDREIDHLH
jgi:hypothetical protein